MIAHAVVVPCPPLLVPGVSPGGPPELVALREACAIAVRALRERSDRWIAVGSHSGDLVVGPAARGSFRGYGADVQVALSVDAADEQDLPLPALVAGWLRDQSGASAVEVHLVAGDTEPAACVRLGEQLDGAGLLVLGDGSNRHGPRAPGSEDHRAPGFDDEVAKALAKADTEALLALDPALASELGATGRAAWQVLAGTGDGWHGELLYSAAPFGVGYHVAVWERG